MSRILVVEDNAANMKLVSLVLRNAGHIVLQAGDAKEALEAARRDTPDLILMDVQLPGMDGLSAARALKENGATCAIPVIALTAMAMQGDAERIRAAGCDGYIAKPIRYRNLLQQLASILAGPTPAPIPTPVRTSGASS